MRPMATGAQSSAGKPSKLRIILMWLLLLGVILFWVVFWAWHNHGRAYPDESEHQMVASVLSLIIGGFFLCCGVVGYVVAVFTGCLNFNYQRPVWPGTKVRLYLANIAVAVLLGLGLGFILSAFIKPTLVATGMDAGLANILPVMVMVAGIQIFQLWVLIWAPMERRLIVNRLEALGI